MKMKLTAVGDEYGLIVDKKILELLEIKPDTELEVTTDAGCLIVEPAAGAPRLRRRRLVESLPAPRPIPVPRAPRSATRVRLPKKQPW